MASLVLKHRFFVAFVLALSVFQMASASDPDILTDFLVPQNVTPDGNFFTFTGMRSLIPVDTPTAFNVTKASAAEFPALIGQSVSMAVLEFSAGSVNPPHTHPRASELLFLAYGSLEVGFVDTTNKLFTQTLQAGDMFIFPKGLVHFQYNANASDYAVALSGFGSASAGTVSLPTTVFSTSINSKILAKSFKTTVSTIHTLKRGLIPSKA
ncbi:germin-like protein 9-3 [Rhodamnia argentea]|uniref:Germin-like protein n=1 Tax=Rhodamnia argentea TaxID=178133 RepID=A0A8B8QTX8_9MYRT|nr:germin-like protein 9-3 [Rhodamnia argentea]